MNTDRELVRGWVQKNYPTFDQILKQAGEETNSRLELEGNPRRMGPDMYSEPFCYEAVNYFPDGDLDFMTKIAWSCVKHLDHVSDKYPLRRTRNWSRQGIETPHWRFHYDGVSDLYIADPTFGQFAYLNESIRAYPDLFVGRILVASSDDIRRNWGIDYK